MNDYAQPLINGSLSFAIRIAKLAQSLSAEKSKTALSQQLLKSGTSVGANIREAQYAQSGADCASKLSIALKEAAKTQYWLEVSMHAKNITAAQYASLRTECDRLVELLSSVIKRMKAKRQKTSPRTPPTL